MSTAMNTNGHQGTILGNAAPPLLMKRLYESLI